MKPYFKVVRQARLLKEKEQDLGYLCRMSAGGCRGGMIKDGYVTSCRAQKRTAGQAGVGSVYANGFSSALGP